MNNSVDVVSSNGKIWDLPKTIFDLQSAARKGPVNINLLYEGPCCVDIGLEYILDQICDLLQVDIDHFVIFTSNQLSSSKYLQYRTSFVELETAQYHCRQNFFSSTLEKRFGLFIGRSNYERLRIASYLHKHYQSQTEMTFHYDPHSEFHRNNFGLEMAIEKSWDDRHQVFDFLNYVPLKNEAHTYPILWDQKGFDLDSQYSKIFCDIVCETYTTGRSFFITEKTFRCIANHRPFIIYGPRYFLKNLKKLGFNTFDSWWDEGYDSDAEDAKYQSIIGNVNWIAEQSHSTIRQWFNEMTPILKHNVRTLQNLTHSQILKTVFYYD
jgi:hypothetical protein